MQLNAANPNPTLLHLVPAWTLSDYIWLKCLWSWLPNYPKTTWKHHWNLAGGVRASFAEVPTMKYYKTVWLKNATFGEIVPSWGCFFTKRKTCLRTSFRHFWRLKTTSAMFSHHLCGRHLLFYQVTHVRLTSLNRDSDRLVTRIGNEQLWKQFGK